MTDIAIALAVGIATFVVAVTGYPWLGRKISEGYRSVTALVEARSDTPGRPDHRAVTSVRIAIRGIDRASEALRRASAQFDQFGIATHRSTTSTGVFLDAHVVGSVRRAARHLTPSRHCPLCYGSGEAVNTETFAPASCPLCFGNRSIGGGAPQAPDADLRGLDKIEPNLARVNYWCESDNTGWRPPCPFPASDRYCPRCGSLPSHLVVY